MENAPRLQKTGPLKVAGLRKHHPFGDAMSARLAAQWQAFIPLLAGIGQAKGRVTYGVCFDSQDDKDNKGDKAGFDYLSAVEVTSTGAIQPPLVSATVPAKTYAVFDHGGHVSSISNTVQSAWDWLASSGRQHDGRGADPVFIERYGEKFDPRSGAGDIEIWLPVKDKSGSGSG